MAAKVNKWMQGLKERMEKKGTTGSLRAIAKKRGLLKDEKDTLTTADANVLIASAKKEKNTKLLRKALAAKNMMKSSGAG